MTYKWFLLVILAFCNCDEELSSNCSKDQLDNDCNVDAPTTVIRVVRGRLGNHMWGHMFNLGLKFNFGLNVVTADASYEHLSR